MRSQKSLTTSTLFFLVVATILGLMCLLFTPNYALASEFPENENLTEAEIQERFREIRTSYEVGEEFSASDANFVLQYATNPNAQLARGSSSFSKTKTSNGTTVTMSGTIYHNGTLNYTYGANATITASGSTPKNPDGETGIL